MARSDRAARRVLRPLAIALAALALPALVACNSILGLSDFEKGECPGARCGDGGEDIDGGVDAGDAGPDALGEAGPGVAPVSWAHWVMPNYPDAANPPSYSVASDSVTDTVTGLTWMRATPGEAQNKSYDDAKAYCAGLPNGPWRLPKRIELVTLFDPTRTPAIDPSFSGTTPTPYWTSSEVRPFGGGGTYQYWVVGFGGGANAVSSLAATGTASVRCVKGGAQ